MRAAFLALSLAGCSATSQGNLALVTVPDAVVTQRVLPLLPEGAILARSVVQGNVGLGGDSLLVTWAEREPRAFHMGAIHEDTLHPFPALHGADVPERIGAVMLVQADADPAGEVVVLVDRTDGTPDRLLATAKQSFEAVVVDRSDSGFVRMPALEAVVAGQSQPNEIRLLLEGAMEAGQGH